MKIQLAITCLLALGITTSAHGIVMKNGYTIVDSRHYQAAKADNATSEYANHPIRLAGTKGGFGRTINSTPNQSAKSGEPSSTPKKKPQHSEKSKKESVDKSSTSSRSRIGYRSIWDPVAY